MGIRTAKWDTEDRFNPGATENFDNTELVGSGASAVIKLTQKSDSENNIVYNDSANYTYSDSNKITVDENDSNLASLKILTSSDINYPFESSLNYDFDSDDIEVNVISSIANLKNSQPANATCFANFNAFPDLTWGDGDTDGIETGGASVDGDGYLDLAHDDIRYVTYDANDNADSPQVGCYRFSIIPNYIGIPTTNFSFIMTGQNTTDNVNQVGIIHNTAGQIRIVMRDQNGSGTSATLGVWNQTRGQEYEFELNYDFNTGANRLFIDGVQFGSTNTTTLTRSSDINILRVGTWNSAEVNSNFKIGYFVVFDAVQHTSNYTAPSETIPANIYSIMAPDISNSVAFSFASELVSFTETSTKPSGTGIKHQISGDDGSTWKYWNGSAWVTRSTSTIQKATSIETTTGDHIGGDLTSILNEDGNLYTVDEVTGTPGFLIDMWFNSCAVYPDTLNLFAQYTGTAGHTVNVDIYNWLTSSWTNLGVVPNGGTIVTEYNYAIPGTPSEYLDEFCRIRVRINHVTAGIDTHILYIDYIELTGTPTNKYYYTYESNIDTDINDNIADLAGSGNFKFKSFLYSDGTDTPLLDNIYVAESVTYSTTDNLYIDTTDTSQINPTDVISWLQILFTSTLPTNTDAKVMFSTDGRVTWVSWNGSSWSAPGDNTLRANATSLTDAVTNFTSLSIGDTKLDVRLFLYTSSNSVTPSVDNIYVKSYGGYETSGSYRSAVYKPLNNTNGVAIKNISFDVDIPTGTTLRVLLRYLAEPYYEDGFTEYQNGDLIDICGDAIQWRANFTSDGIDTPVIRYVYVTFHTLIGVWNEVNNILETDIAEIKTNTENIEDKIDDVLIDTSAIESKVDIVDTNVDTINTNVDEINTNITLIDTEIELIKKLTYNNVTKSGNIITIYDDDGSTVWKQYDLSNGGRILQ